MFIMDVSDAVVTRKCLIFEFYEILVTNLTCMVDKYDFFLKNNPITRPNST